MQTAQNNNRHASYFAEVPSSQPVVLQLLGFCHGNVYNELQSSCYLVSEGLLR